MKTLTKIDETSSKFAMEIQGPDNWFYGWSLLPNLKKKIFFLNILLSEFKHAFGIITLKYFQQLVNESWPQNNILKNKDFWNDKKKKKKNGKNTKKQSLASFHRKKNSNSH